MQLVLGLESAGIMLTLEEFDSIAEYDENYHYELIHGVLVVTSIPLADVAGPNDLLGYLLRDYCFRHPQGRALDQTLPQQYVRLRRSRRLADRLIWTGLGRTPNLAVDVAAIAVEFVSAGRRNRWRDYKVKRREYLKAGVLEYWIIDRFQRTMTVVRQTSEGPEELVIAEGDVYRTPLLPGFELPLAKLIEAADRRSQQ